MLRFAKYEGLGNDFVVVSAPLSAAACAQLCDRHRGVGADGVLAVLPSRIAGAVRRMHITNADGSVPEMCGNGLRCVSLFLVDTGVVRVGEEHVVDTDAGPRAATVLADGTVRVDMGPARFEVPGQIPALFRSPVVVDGAPFTASAVSMGNPHVVLETPADVSMARRVGPILEHDPRFPARTNVELAALAADGGIDVVVWERGVGITEACGTGACAVAAAFARAGLVPFDTDVTVRLPGGPLVVRVPSGAGPVWMTGAARHVFDGTADGAVDAVGTGAGSS